MPTNRRPLPDAMLDAFTASLGLAEKPPDTKLGPLEWAKKNATLVLPVEGRVHFDPYPYQACIMSDDSPRRLILKARQTGISNMIALEALHLTLTKEYKTVLFVSRNKTAAAQLIAYCKHTWDNLTGSYPRLTTDNQSELGWDNHSRIISLPSNKSTGRSFSATRVYLDEFAFANYDSYVYESVGGTVSTGGDMTVLSTPNGRTNMFYRLWSGLEGGSWSRHQVHWSECPRYTAEWAKERRAEMSAQSWAQEYDLDFAMSGLAVFNESDLRACRDADYEPAKMAFSRMIYAWDIGRRHDHTVCVGLGQLAHSDDWYLAHFERFLQPYPVIQSRIEAVTLSNPHAEHYIESNGIGDPVIENLSERARELVTPFVMTARSKVQAVQALQLLVEQHHFHHNEQVLDRELSLYQWDDKGLIQDTVMASATAANFIADMPVPLFRLDPELTGASKWKIS